MARELISFGNVIGRKRNARRDVFVETAQTFKHILVPVWLLSYLYSRQMYQVVVNGYDGRMAGQYPKSPWKIALLVLLAIIVLMIFVMLNQNN